MPSRKRQDQTGNGSPNLNSLKNLRLALDIFAQALADLPFFCLVPIAPRPCSMAAGQFQPTFLVSKLAFAASI